jgi:hypothetical protein
VSLMICLFSLMIERVIRIFSELNYVRFELN